MVRYTISKIKRLHTEWENILANTSDKGLISKIYNDLQGSVLLIRLYEKLCIDMQDDAE